MASVLGAKFSKYLAAACDMFSKVRNYRYDVLVKYKALVVASIVMSF